MATAPEIKIRGIGESEYEGWFIDHDVAFGRRATAEDAARARPAVEVDRALAAFDGEAIVGTTHALSVELTLPGGACPTALVDMVGVLPTHRRRGVLTRMMERQLSDIHERGEPLAALTASESVIYGRFGYGIVSMHEEWSIDKEHSALATRIEPKGRIRFVDSDAAKGPVLEVYLGVTTQRPGMVRYRSGSYETFLAGGGHGQAGGAVFRVVYEEEGRPLGYAKYRTEDDILEVQELMGLTPAAWAALWGYCLGMDLTTGATASRRPVDDPLLWMLADPARLRRSVMDRMWLRIVDVGPALERRRYGVEGGWYYRSRTTSAHGTRACMSWRAARATLRAGGRARSRTWRCRRRTWPRRTSGPLGSRRWRAPGAWPSGRRGRCQWRTRCFVRGWRRGRLIICEGGGRWKETAPV